MGLLGLFYAALTLAPQTGARGVREAAQDAQRAFEQFHIDHLPPVFSGASRRCDEQVGRFCYWHDDDEDDAWRPPPEPPGIQFARRALIATLDSLGPLSPADDWITGQRIRYLAEAGETARALALAQRCQGTPWWCAALTGFARHVAGDFAASDSAFAASLRLMPRDQRCAWTDLSLLLTDLRGAYRRLPCEARDSLARWVWWLADPLYMVPGNERRTEHLARLVLDQLQDDAYSTHGLRWGNDLRELLIRYGWPVAWARDRTRTADGVRPVVVSYHPSWSRQFMPSAEFVRTPSVITSEGWELDPDRPRSAYAPSYATRVEALDAQLAVFRRGDSAVVVAGYALGSSDRTLDSRITADAAVVITVHPDSPLLVGRGTGQATSGVAALIIPELPGLASVEVLTHGDSARAYRARQWVAVESIATGGVALSDPLLLDVHREDSLPASLEEALPRVRGAARVRPGEALGLYWEMYGELAGGLTVSITVFREPSWLQRFASRIGVRRRDRPLVTLSWREAPLSARVVPRSIVLAMPDETPGTYVLAIEIRTPGERTATAERVLTITSPPQP